MLKSTSRYTHLLYINWFTHTHTYTHIHQTHCSTNTCTPILKAANHHFAHSHTLTHLVSKINGDFFNYNCFSNIHKYIFIDTNSRTNKLICNLLVKKVLKKEKITNPYKQENKQDEEQTSSCLKVNWYIQWFHIPKEIQISVIHSSSNTHSPVSLTVSPSINPHLSIHNSSHFF